MSAGIVDTAALAAGLNCTPQFVLRLTRLGILTPVDKVRTSRIGRPSKGFDWRASKKAVDDAVASGRVELDQGAWRVRKSK